LTAVTGFDHALPAELLVAQAGPGGVYERTLLLIFGDHGQTLGGDHGGGSGAETDSVLLAAGVGQLAAALQLQVQQAGGGDASSRNSSSFSHCQEEIQQVDLTPTLALLLGLPIPYGSIGKVPQQLWSVLAANGSSAAAGGHAHPDASCALGAGAGSYAAALADNADQVHTYLGSYAAAASLPARRLAESEALYAAAQQLRASDAGLQDSVDAELAYLEAAGQLARAQFTQFDLRFMLAGCCAAAAVLLWQLSLCQRHWGWGWPSSRAGGWAAWLQPGWLLAIAAAGHAVGLFSVGVLMGEGRVQCHIIAALTLLAARAALQAAFAARRAAAVNGCREPPLAASLSKQGSASSTEVLRCDCRGLHSDSDLADVPPPPAAAPAPQAQLPGSWAAAGGGSAHAGVVAALMGGLLAANAGLQATGLIDRSGQDPHDKSEPSTELLGAAGAQGGSWLAAAQAWAVAVVPLVLVMVMLLWADRWLSRQQDAGSRARHAGSRSSGASRALAACAAAATAAELACIAAWWSLQLTGLAGVSSAQALAAALGRPGGASAAGSPGLLAAAAQLPLGLLLPRLVYAITVAVMLAYVAVAAARAAAWRRRVGPGPPAGGHPLGAARAYLWLAACLLGPVVLTLGHKGPTLACIAVAQSLMLVALLGQLPAGGQVEAGGAGAGTAPAGGAALAPAVEAGAPADGGVALAFGGGMWSMYSMQVSTQQSLWDRVGASSRCGTAWERAVAVGTRGRDCFLIVGRRAQQTAGAPRRQQQGTDHKCMPCPALPAALQLCFTSVYSLPALPASISSPALLCPADRPCSSSSPVATSVSSPACSTQPHLSASMRWVTGSHRQWAHPVQRNAHPVTLMPRPAHVLGRRR
jgi:hypothetical protein